MVSIDRDGILFSSALLVVAGVMAVAAYSVGNIVVATGAVIILAFALFTGYFFRDPERSCMADSDSVVSAADGVVVDITKAPEEGNTLRIAVFMNVFNVHVNRSPVAGNVTRTAHTPGRKLNAMSARAAEENEYGEVEIESSHGVVRVRQIAGLIARRVVTRVKPEDVIARGDRIGLIRFGSRVDVYLPETFTATVREGDRVYSGETVIAKLADKNQREG